nr:MAG TPA: hypothetical protein [Caudoviricetes sp.]
MSQPIGEERWDELDEEIRDFYRANQISHLALKEVYGKYPMPQCVVDQNGNRIDSYSSDRGHLVFSKIKVHYPEIKEVPPRYDVNGYITRPGLIPFPEKDEEIEVFKYVPYTPEEQEKHDKAKEEARRRYEIEEANRKYMLMLLPVNLMSMSDDMAKSISSIIPEFDINSNYPIKSVIKFENKNYRAKSDIQPNDLTPDKNDKWYEVK